MGRQTQFLSVRGMSVRAPASHPYPITVSGLWMREPHVYFSVSPWFALGFIFVSSSLPRGLFLTPSVALSHGEDEWSTMTLF